MTLLKHKTQSATVVIVVVSVIFMAVVAVVADVGLWLKIPMCSRGTFISKIIAP